MTSRAEQSWYAAQRVVVVAVVALTGILVVPSLANPFQVPKIAAVLVGAVAAVAAAGFRALRSRRLSVVRGPLAAILLAFVVGMTVSTALSPSAARALWGTYTRYAGLLPYAAYVVLLLSVIHAFDRRSLDLLVRWMLLAGFVVAAYGAIQTAGLDPVTWRLEGLPAAFSTMGNGNFAAAYVGALIPVAVWWILHRRADPFWAAGAGLLVVLGVVTMLGSDSAQGWAVSAVGLALLAVAGMLERWPQVREWLADRVAWVAGLAGLGWLAAVGATASLGPAVLGERGYIYDAAVDVFLDHPVIGTGVGTFADYFFRYRQAEHALTLGSSTTTTAHSVPLDFLAGGGMFVFLPYVAFVLLVGWMLIRGLLLGEGPHRRLLAAFGAVWLGYQAQSLISIDVPALATLHWISAGAIIVLASEPSFLSRRVGGMKGGAATALRVGLAVVAIAVAWTATRPLRADIAAASAVDHFRRAELADSQEQFRRAHELMPHVPFYWFLEASAYERAQMLDRAFEAIAQAARLERGDSVYALQAGRFAEAQGDLARAEEWYLEAADRDPNAPQMLLAAAEFLSAQGQEERARELLDHLLGIQPGNAEAQRLLDELGGAPG